MNNFFMNSNNIGDTNKSNFNNKSGEFKSDLLNIFSERGFLYQATDLTELDKKLASSVTTAYVGFDATAKSLQVGNLSAIMSLRWLQKCGHKPIVLVGGGTSRIGDPSFRNSMRPVMTEEIIFENINGIKSAFNKLLHFENSECNSRKNISNFSSSDFSGSFEYYENFNENNSKNGKNNNFNFDKKYECECNLESKSKMKNNSAIIVNNADWLNNLQYIDFLRDFGIHFTVNKMISFESVKTRLENEDPLSFLEFNYMLLQAYDFLHLAKNYDCTLQMGGSDQWGNIVNGVDLTRKLLTKKVFGLTSPLVVKSSGEKMGKTAGGAIWLNEEDCSPYDYWQFWRNTDDRDVGKYLRRFTELPISEIEKLEKLGGEEINEAKIILANETTKLMHGEKNLKKILDTVDSVLSGNGLGEMLPTINISKNLLPVPMHSVFLNLGFCQSISEFKRLVDGGGAKMNGETILDVKMLLKEENFNNGKLKISFGKKKHGIVNLV